MPDSRPPPAKAARPRSGRHAVPAPGPQSDSEDFTVVGIGASAGGLQACRKLVNALASGTGMAFVLVQHLDPTHESMMVDLLSEHTAMRVRQATDGMKLERDQLYVIPPGTYLSVSDGVLHLSQPQARHGARLPFDFLLHSLAEAYGARAVCIILSGTGADGSLGLKAVKEKGGLVIVQDPAEAGYDGMPRNAIMTDAVDLVLPVAEIPAALVAYDRRVAPAPFQVDAEDAAADWLAEIIDLLRTKTPHDFRLYKPGTLQRRIARRMAMASIGTGDVEGYLDLLRTDPGELDQLAKDLLINITSFFRDPEVFDLLAKTIIPELVTDQGLDQPLRIWIAGCSTGEETYSLAILFREQIAAANRNLKLQVFASDVDPDAVARAREGLYPDTIKAEVSPERLARFFTKEGRFYRVLPELRSCVVFTVQDLLADPPFSRLDLVSCRNLMIYLQPEAQTKVLALFHFALREDGILLLGNAETVGTVEGRFKLISKPARLYRHLGRSRPGDLAFTGVRVPVRPGQGLTISRQSVLGELCRRLVTEAFAPAAVLINRRHECLFSLGPTDRYLRVPPGQPTHDLLAMARQNLRSRLTSAIQQVARSNSRVIIPGGRVDPDGTAASFSIDIQPVQSEGEELLLVCFVDDPVHEPKRDGSVSPGDVSRVAELERELDATRTELQAAIRNLEASSEEQMAINEEALSINEEYQSTNEELLTSKEELQSLNEELTALNSQLQETLERQRTTANDLQNILYSTDVATLFLDRALNIRFFTPATKSLFSILPGDVGRPLADLSSLAPDGALLSDARTVLSNSIPIEREIGAKSGAWYIRRILPYRTQDDGIEGVVITFSNITDRKHSADVLDAAKREAELANLAKSRFLAAASHDLRQPLQTLALLQGLLAKTVESEKARKLVGRLDQTLGAMTGMLNTLLDMNQIEAGTVRAEIVDFPINQLLERLRDEFSYLAQAQRLDFHMVPCGLLVQSDPPLLEQMIRNLLSNALKYTKRGRILIGCRRCDGMVRIEVWDTGVGIPEAEHAVIFEEYHQLDNSARNRSRGLGLGLAIVQRLARLLGHRVRLRSIPGKGSVFSIEVPFGARATAPSLETAQDAAGHRMVEAAQRTGLILVVEDDPELRELLEILLKGEGHRIVTACDGVVALDWVAQANVAPDLVLADFNLPNGVNGLQLTAKLRESFGRQIPVIILTGDISTGTLRDIGLHNCVQLNKPVKTQELKATIDQLLPKASMGPHRPAPPIVEAVGDRGTPVIFVVDDDSQLRDALRSVLEEEGRIVEDFPDCESFLDAYRPGQEGCLLIDAYLPGMNGLELLQRLRELGHRLPSIMITGNSDVPMAVQAMKAGATDFIEKPVSRGELLASVDRALEQSHDATKLSAWREDAADHVAGLTIRQREIMELVLAGHPSKNIAADLGISQRTVENHRAAIMKKTGSKSLPALARLALAATATDDPPMPSSRTPVTSS
jgi:two-component system, chemotaxis family, CheB/CheR fusion protein